MPADGRSLRLEAPARAVLDAALPSDAEPQGGRGVRLDGLRLDGRAADGKSGLSGTTSGGVSYSLPILRVGKKGSVHQIIQGGILGLAAYT